MMATKNIRGLLVTNAFLKNGKFVEHYEWLREAARQQEIRLDLCDNAMLHAIYGMESDEAKLASYSFIILEMTQMYFKKDRSYLSKSLYKSPVLILYRYFKKRMIEKKQITITFYCVVCNSGV